MAKKTKEEKKSSAEKGVGSTALVPSGGAPARGRMKAPVGGMRKESAPPMQLPGGIGIDMQRLISTAIEKMVPIDYMQKLLDMVETMRAQWARQQFFKDLALAQAEFPVIEKKSEARDTNKACPVCHGKPGDLEKCRACEGTGHPLLYVYAPYEDIASVIDPIAAGYGFSSTTKTKPFKNPEIDMVMMRGICLLHHKDGHTEETEVEVPIGEGTRLMSAMQKYRSAASFARRHAYIDAHGVKMRGEDVEHVEEGPQLEEPRAVAGVQVSKEGVLTGGGKQAAVQTTPRQAGGDPSVPSLKAARLALQKTFDLMYQVYDSDRKPMTNPDGSPVTDMPPKDHPRAPFVRLFTTKELEDHWGYVKKVGDDAAKLVDINLDWIAELAERKAVKEV